MANRQTWATLLLAMLLVLDLNQCPFVIGWALLPTHHEFNIENALSKDLLDVQCNSNNEGALGLAHVPLHGNYTHGFKTGLFKTVTYTCTLTNPNTRAFKVFEVFIDAQKFIDNQCGGRHCFWKVQDDGIYLYQIHKNEYIKRYDWDHT